MIDPALLLISWVNVRKDAIKRISGVSDKIALYIDSGAFTAFTQGDKVDLKEYMAWLKSPPVPVERYFQLDVIGEPEATLRNLKIMQDAGLHPIPVFTRGMDFDALEDIYSASDLIAVGGLVQTPNRLGYIKRLMREVGDRDIHWLGVTNPQFIARYRPYSCDSSSWVAGRKFARISLYMGKGRFTGYTKPDAGNKSPTAEQAQVIRSFGFDPTDLGRKANWHGNSPAYILGRRSFVRYANEVKSKFGTKMYAAIMDGYQAEELMSDYEWEAEHASSVI